MKIAYLIGVGFYYGYLMSKAKIEFGSGLWFQFFLAQTLLLIGGAL